MDTSNEMKRVVVLGGGFGGLTFIRSLDTSLTKVTLVDKQNHHLFQPLLYQVATAGLAAPNIAQPLRSIFARRANVEVVMDSVEEIDLENEQVVLSRKRLDYDFLVIALGSETNYFGHDEWSRYASGLKTLSDAHRIRNDTLGAFELAETLPENAPQRKRLMTSVVIGAGPTGVELAGTLAELANRYFKRDFRHIDTRDARVILIDAVDRVLPSYSERLSAKAKEQLESLGVEVVTGKKVEDIQDRKVILEDRTIEAENIIWTAGVSANAITQKMDTPKGKGGRIEVERDCSLPGRPNVFAIGDIVSLIGADGKPVPGVAPAAMQMAKHIARIIEKELKSPTTGPEVSTASNRPAFEYTDKGNMATIGRSRAVADIKGREFSGFFAWFLWLAIHLILLIGMRNRLLVLLQWFYAYVRCKPGARIIWKAQKEPEQDRARSSNTSTELRPKNVDASR